MLEGANVVREVIPGMNNISVMLRSRASGVCPGSLIRKYPLWPCMWEDAPKSRGEQQIYLDQLACRLNDGDSFPQEL